MESTGDDGATSNAPFRVPTIGEAVGGKDGDDNKDEFDGLDEIKGSLCMACGGDGTTRMLTTKIPFFREVILSSFECDNCHWRNNEVRMPVSHEKNIAHCVCSIAALLIFIVQQALNVTFKEYDTCTCTLVVHTSTIAVCSAIMIMTSFGCQGRPLEERHGLYLVLLLQCCAFVET